jgi:hypothetical protein
VIKKPDVKTFQNAMPYTNHEYALPVCVSRDHDGPLTVCDLFSGRAQRSIFSGHYHIACYFDGNGDGTFLVV